MDILEISPTSECDMKKVVVSGELFSKYVVVIPVQNQTAEKIAEELSTRWISFSCPPLRLLSDQGKVLMGDVVRHLCAGTGT